MKGAKLTEDLSVSESVIARWPTDAPFGRVTRQESSETFSERIIAFRMW